MNRSREHAQVLMHRAHDDQWMLNRLLEDPQAPQWGLGFHAQQAVEKAIKAVLTANSVEFPRTHDVAMVLDLLSSNGLDQPPGAAELTRLTPFGAALWYDDAPDADGQEPELDGSWLRVSVQRTVEWAERMVARAKEKT